MTEEPDLIVVGERAALGPLRRDLAATYARWVNDAGVRFGLGHVGIATRESEEKWVDDAVEKGAEREPTVAAFTVYDAADRVAVGTATLFDINQRHGAAQFGIAIGERRGQGIGADATRLMLRWAFETLGLHSVELQAYAWNEEAIRAYEKAGFARAGLGARRPAAAALDRRRDHGRDRARRRLLIERDDGADARALAGRAVHLELAAQELDAVGEPAQARAACGVGAADAVVGHLDLQAIAVARTRIRAPTSRARSGRRW